jgi:N-acetylmuramoyl-L-alanine amidase
MGRLSEYKVFALYRPFRVIVDVRGEPELSGASDSGPLDPATLRLRSGQASLRAGLAEDRPAPQFRYKIVLDPGHGGRDPGAQGINGVEEKEVALAIVRRLSTKLRERLPVEVVLTRVGDVFIPLAERTAMANAAGADLFVSIHANASTNLDLQGVETYYLNNTNDRATIRLAAMENGLGFVGGGTQNAGGELSYILSDLIQTGKEEESVALARHIQRSVVERLQTKYPGVKNLGVKKGPFYVLVGAYMPCVLVETSFLTHKLEGKRLTTSAYQEEIAAGLFLGIARFLKENHVAKNL